MRSITQFQKCSHFKFDILELEIQNEYGVFVIDPYIISGDMIMMEP
jgi:hypothetical protein